MLALFQCCANPFFAVSQESGGLRFGSGYQQSTPIVLRVRCPHCNQKAEARLAAPCLLAYRSPAIHSGIRLLREPHGARLFPIQLTSGRLVELPMEDVSSLSRAWDLITVLSAASNATGRTLQPGELSVTDTSALLTYLHPDLQTQLASTAEHCGIANTSLSEPTCNWPTVRMKWKRTPEIDGRI